MIILALGSNLPSKIGSRFENIDHSIFLLQKYKINLLVKSSFYETPSYPDQKKPKFINVIISVNSHLNIYEFVDVLFSVENELGRVRNKKNDPRTCDIDIIDYNSKTLKFMYKNYDLVIPHKNLSMRNFVLYPLKEILPNWKHPQTNEHITDLIKKLPEEYKNSILKIKKP